MPSFEIDKQKNIIKYEGDKFKLDEVKAILKDRKAEMFNTITCPNEIKYVLTEEAKNVLRSLSNKNQKES